MFKSKLIKHKVLVTLDVKNIGIVFKVGCIFLAKTHENICV